MNRILYTYTHSYDCNDIVRIWNTCSIQHNDLYDIENYSRYLCKYWLSLDMVYFAGVFLR